MDELKLFLIEINNGLDYEDYDESQKLVVSKSKVVASVIAIEFMNECYGACGYGTPNFHVIEIKEVDGYKINVCRKDGD